MCSDRFNKNSNLTIPWPGVSFSFLGGRLWVLHTFYSGTDQNCAIQGFIVSLLQHVLDYWERKEDLKVENFERRKLEQFDATALYLLSDTVSHVRGNEG